ncbi:TPA: hypothetical protein N3A33_005355 [Salmonella enterica subsp. salamae serovar 28:r:e,n,z15]|nr:hypothetical protein [Salmonella enterica subsp. salamae serovar 28:r:e,n,z15]
MIARTSSGYDFTDGRQFAAWLSLTPSQYSNGGKLAGGGNNESG